MRPLSIPQLPIVMFIWIRKIIALPLTLTLIVPSPALLAQAVAPEDEEEMLQAEVIELSPFEVSAGSSAGYAATSTVSGMRMGATPGGAQDINFFRSSAGRGEVPHPNTITAEGLFSEYDLPLDLGKSSDTMFVVQSAAMRANLPQLPEATHFAQIGLSAGMAAATWKRAPLNLIAVVDKSGSMRGQPLSLVRESLTRVIAQMGPEDQLGIVLYGDRSHVHLEPTKLTHNNRGQVRMAVNAIASAGSTNMEAGLAVGYALAQQSAREFDGNTRVMLFTDERPNVGNTSAKGFMGMARTASESGVGMTTIGVGIQFGAELATKISSVRGGNLFFFPDAAEMKKTFAEDFDTMVTELAHDLRLKITPKPGFKIAGVFGLPANMLRWEGDAIAFSVETIFISKRKGGIYFAIARDNSTENPYLPQSSPRIGESVASIDFSFRENLSDDISRSSTLTRIVSSGTAQLGLTRGHTLVDQFLTLRQAATAHLVENDQELAWQLVNDLRRRITATRDRALQPEVDLVNNLHDTFAFLAGRTDAINSVDATNAKSPLVGTWIGAKNWDDEQPFMIVWPDGSFEFGDIDHSLEAYNIQTELVPAQALPHRKSGKFELFDEYSRTAFKVSYQLKKKGLSLTLTDPEGRKENYRLTRTSHAQLLADSTFDEPEDENEAWPEVNPLNGLPAKS
ncbi:MAG: hypothetical protein SynsKO_24290 [Synoicihabitans sp.]